MANILAHHPDWVGVRTGSDGTNPWMDAVVFVAPDQVRLAVAACAKGLDEFWGEAGNNGMCYGDCIEEQLALARARYEIVYAESDGLEPTKEWSKWIDGLYKAGKIIVEVF